jgi:hypothetical protein
MSDLKPRYKNTILCKCGAEFSKDTEWSRGFDMATGTENPKHSHVSIVSKNQCPICLTSHKE